MLVLSRKKDEAVIITVGEIRIRVVPCDLRGDKIRIGFEAPASVSIHREEVQNVIDEELAGKGGAA